MLISILGSLSGAPACINVTAVWMSVSGKETRDWCAGGTEADSGVRSTRTRDQIADGLIGPLSNRPRGSRSGQRTQEKRQTAHEDYARQSVLSMAGLLLDHGDLE